MRRRAGRWLRELGWAQEDPAGNQPQVLRVSGKLATVPESNAWDISCRDPAIFNYLSGPRVLPRG